MTIVLWTQANENWFQQKIALIKGKCPWRDSNAQPTAPQAVALSIKLQGHNFSVAIFYR